MNKFERNKITGALFAALLVVMVTRVSSRIIFTPHEPNPKAFVVADMDATGGSEQGAQKAEPEIPLPVLLAKANIASGEKAARICQACHNMEEGAGAKVGPDLYKIVGRHVASANGFGYTQAMKKRAQDPQTQVWTFDTLFTFLKDPRGQVPGTAMTFAGIEDPQKRADLIAYLNTLGSNVPLPPVPETQAQTPEAKESQSSPHHA